MDTRKEGYTWAEWANDFREIGSDLWNKLFDYPIVFVALFVLCGTTSGCLVGYAENYIKTYDQKKLYKENFGKEKCFVCGGIFVYKEFNWVRVNDPVHGWVYVCSGCNKNKKDHK